MQGPGFYSPLFHLGQCSMKCLRVSLSSLHPTRISLFSAKNSLPSLGYLFSLSITPLTVDFHCNPPLSFLFGIFHISQRVLLLFFSPLFLNYLCYSSFDFFRCLFFYFSFFYLCSVHVFSGGFPPFTFLVFLTVSQYSF